MEIIVVVNTEEDLGLEAVSKVLESLNVRAEIISYTTDPGIGGQPIGMHYMKERACHRALHAQQRHPEADFCIGIEKGILPSLEENRWLDAFYVCIRRLEDGRESGAFGTPFPPSEEVAEDIGSYLPETPIPHSYIVRSAVLRAISPLLPPSPSG